MWNFSEQPWTLVGIAVIALFIVFTYRSVIPEKRHWWQFLIPLLIAAAGFGIDALTQTDNEQIEAVLNAGIKAIEVENFSQIEPYLTDDYRDSIHATKERLIEHAQNQLNTNLVKKCKKTGLLIKLSQNNTKAKVNFFIQIVLSKDSEIVQTFNFPLVNVSADIDFVKQNDKWLIDNIEIRKINNIQARWSDVR